jgi:hypothetical protein
MVRNRGYTMLYCLGPCHREYGARGSNLSAPAPCPHLWLVVVAGPVVAPVVVAGWLAGWLVGAQRPPCNLDLIHGWPCQEAPARTPAVAVPGGLSHLHTPTPPPYITPPPPIIFLTRSAQFKTRVLRSSRRESCTLRPAPRTLHPAPPRPAPPRPRAPAPPRSSPRLSICHRRPPCCL